jgi:uncharacterized membrane protein
MHLRILQDRRLQEALRSVEEQSSRPFLDILAVVFAHLPEILAALNNPAALVALILSLLQQPKAAA